MDTSNEDLPIVVVGAGLGGSATAAFLARAGIRTLVLERHSTAVERPRAWVVSPRTIEMLRQLGIADQVIERGSADPWMMVQTATLITASSVAPLRDESAEISANGSATCDQDLLEALLLDRAVELGARFRRGVTVTGIRQRDAHVEVQVGDAEVVRARYVVLASGSRPDLVHAAGINTRVPPHGGRGPSSAFDQVLFRSTTLDMLMDGVPGNAFVTGGNGDIVFRRNLHRWQLQRLGSTIDDPASAITTAAGQEVDVEILDHSQWTPSARVADRYRAGDVFLVGDAARSFPPSLGMGGNLAIADAHNLAWKLAWVRTGSADRHLLDSYEPERKPIGDLIMTASVDRMLGKPTIDLLTAQLGLGYPTVRSDALIDDGADANASGPSVFDPRDPTPRVGARLPHRWLPDGRSTIDLTNIGTFAAVGPHALALNAVSYTRVPGLPTGSDPDRIWLVRPDGHLAAHLHPDDVGAALHRVLGTGN